MATTTKKNTVKKAPASSKEKKAAAPINLDATVYDQKGKAAGTVALAANVFGLAWNNDLVHQVVTSMTANARAGTAHTKFRGEVSGTGKKPWKQKGTGRARHGSTRSPIWVGGGVSHGPRAEKNFDKKINKKMKTKALFTLLSKKYKDGQVLFVDDIALSAIKTKTASDIVQSFAKIAGFEKLKAAKKPAAFMAIASRNATLEKSFANLPQIALGNTSMLSPLDILNHKYLVFVNPEATAKALASRAQ